MRKKPHYFYRFAETSNAGKQLQAFFIECNDAQEQARAWVEKQGGDSYFESPEGMAGGVSLVEFKNTIAKDGWEKLTVHGEDVFFYPTPDSALEKEMYSLPVVSEMKLIPILSVKAKKTKDGKLLPFTFGEETPVIFLLCGYWYVDVPYESEDADAERMNEPDFFAQMAVATKDRE